MMIVKRAGSRFYLTAIATIDDVETLSGVEVAVMPQLERPAESDWQLPEIINGHLKLLVENLPKGDYVAWARITDNSEQEPVSGDIVRIV